MSRKKKDFTENYYDRKPIRPMNDLQGKYINAIKNHTIVVGTGVAGSGKSFIASTLAVDMLEDPRSKIEKIIIARPNELEGTKSIGFLKGGLVEKMMPLVAPIADTMKARVGPNKFKFYLETEVIELLPLEYIKGRSFNNCFVIVDEAEDIEWSVLKTLILRLGKDSKLVIDGDMRQCSISKHSGLQQLLDLDDQYHLPVSFIDFHSWDYCVRSDECKLFGQIFEEAKV